MSPPPKREKSITFRAPLQLHAELTKKFPGRTLSDGIKSTLETALPYLSGQHSEALNRFNDYGLADIIPDFYDFDYAEYLAHESPVVLVIPDLGRFIRNSANRYALNRRWKEGKTTHLFLVSHSTPDGAEFTDENSDGLFDFLKGVLSKEESNRRNSTSFNIRGVTAFREPLIFTPMAVFASWRLPLMDDLPALMFTPTKAAELKTHRTVARTPDGRSEVTFTGRGSEMIGRFLLLVELLTRPVNSHDIFPKWFSQRGGTYKPD